VLRRRRQPGDPLAHVDPRVVAPRFAPAVRAALAARARYADVVAGVGEGPVRDRLVDVGARIDAGVLAVWEAARRAGEIERTVAALDPERVIAEYKEARRDQADDPEREAALAARFASVQRLLNALDDTDDRLRTLDARLGAAVAGAAEVALGVGGDAAAEAVETELDDVVTELDALRVALRELG
jgi:hypothetical protein